MSNPAESSSPRAFIACWICLLGMCAIFLYGLFSLVGDLFA